MLAFNSIYQRAQNDLEYDRTKGVHKVSLQLEGLKKCREMLTFLLQREYSLYGHPIVQCLSLSVGGMPQWLGCPYLAGGVSPNCMRPMVNR